MSTGDSARPSSRSTHSRSSASRSVDRFARPYPPTSALTPELREQSFQPCASTASFLLHAQQNTVLVLHHDTLAIERRFDLHREDVLWLVVDNVSERGAGRIAVSFDVGNTAIVWDILNGNEIARFSAYEPMRVASFLRNGNIAFGNDQGNIILFDPSTSEHLSSRTIFDPITAIAPAADCRMYAIGYLNGSILIATLQPSFTILHTLNTTRAPSRITGLAWHGSSSKQKTDMLATQTQDGDLRVWSVPKTFPSESPTIIRVLQRSDMPMPGPCWFAWSRNGRLIQYADGETRAWDVRTKKVTYEVVPTVDSIVGIANYGPTATLFTLGRNHTVQQYDVNPAKAPMQVASVQHIPANTPPTPPNMLMEERRNPYADFVPVGKDAPPLATNLTDADSSADESAALSPLQKIRREIDSLDALQSEIRDKVMPLSPTTDSVSSKSSGRSGRRTRKYLYDRPGSSHASSVSGYEGTEFSYGLQSSKPGRESASMRSITSFQSHHRQRSSGLRKEPRPSTAEQQQPQDTTGMDLFPSTKSRLRKVAFRTPHYGHAARTPELLQREMLSTVFGWNDDVRALIRDEVHSHPPGAPHAVLLSKWLGDGADDMASMIGSQSMTSSDWMLLALSSIGQDTQKKVGEAFVQRLLEKGDIHPAVAILLGLGEINDAVEVYVSQQLWMEALLLACLMFPSDWGRTSYLLRKWGESEVSKGEAELAVRCFSCTSIQTTEPWASPHTQDAIFAAQQEQQQRIDHAEPMSAGPVLSPISPPGRSGSNRVKNAQLKLITSFGDRGAPLDRTAGPDDRTARAMTEGVTPIIQSALPGPASPGGVDAWRARELRRVRDPSSARTATPGSFNAARKRLPSRNDIERAKLEAAELATPLTAARDPSRPRGVSRTGKSRRAHSIDVDATPMTALKPSVFNPEKRLPRLASQEDVDLPSPAKGVFTRFREESRTRGATRDRNHSRLAVRVSDNAHHDDPSHGNYDQAASSRDAQRQAVGGATSPPLTSTSSKASVRGRATDDYISSVEEARIAAHSERASSRRRGESRRRNESRNGRASSRMRDTSRARTSTNVLGVEPAKASPTSPVSMSSAEIAQANKSQNAEPANTDDENFYKASLTSPVESHRSGRSGRSVRSKSGPRRRRVSEDQTGMGESLGAPRSSSRTAARKRAPDPLLLNTDSGRGRSEQRAIGSIERSPSSPLPVLSDKRYGGETDIPITIGERVRMRSQSTSRQPTDLQSRRQTSRDRRDRSTSRRPTAREDPNAAPMSALPKSNAEDQGWPSAEPSTGVLRPRDLTKRELAAKELEERRKSLARRPSAPQIPLPGELQTPGLRPGLGQRSHTELGDSPTSYMPISRSHTVEPDMMSRGQVKTTGTSTATTPIGLPATPRAMRHPRYMNADPNERDAMPPVPDIPGKFSDVSLSGSSLSQATGSSVSQSSVATSLDQPQLGGVDSIGPLLPSTVYVPTAITARSASAPPEKNAQVHPMYKSGLPSSNRRMSASRGHVRKISPPDVPKPAEDGDPIASIDAALHGGHEQVIIVPDQPSDPNAPPIMLPELQHLAGPPPPPPPPVMLPPGQNHSGMISIAIDDNTPAITGPELSATTYPYAMERSQTASPTHRRGGGSVSESFSSRIRGFGLRSSSKSRTKSPPIEYTSAPYETVLSQQAGHHRRDSSVTRAQSPYEQAMAAQNPGGDARLNETSIPPANLPGPRSASAMGGYRHPREIRANMPPDTLQQGVYPGEGGYL